MRNKLIRSAVLGGVVVFLWSSFSWMVLPWHQVSFKQFQNEEKVAEVIRENAPESGIYILPNTCAYNKSCDATNHEAKNRAAEGKEKMALGPVVFASVQPFGVDPNMSRPIFFAVLMNIIGAFIITWMVAKLNTTYWGNVGYVVMMGLLVGLLGLLPEWNWWNFSLSYVIVGIMDLIIGWFFGGVVIARILAKRA